MLSEIKAVITNGGIEFPLYGSNPVWYDGQALK